MGLLSNSPVAGLFLFLTLSTCLYISSSSIHQTKPIYDKLSKTKANERLGNNNNPAKPQSNSVETGVHTESSDISRDIECSMAPESRFDCSRDRLLSRRECAERGCCYAPLADSAGPPWCFYPSVYPGYKMGPLTPTMRGQEATLSRDTPSYLPRDISTLHLEVIEEAAGCFHLTVSTQYTLKT